MAESYRQKRLKELQGTRSQTSAPSDGMSYRERRKLELRGSSDQWPAGSENAMRAGSAQARQSAESNQQRAGSAKAQQDALSKLHTKEANKQAFESAGLGFGGSQFNQHMDTIKRVADGVAPHATLSARGSDNYSMDDAYAAWFGDQGAKNRLRGTAWEKLTPQQQQSAIDSEKNFQVKRNVQLGHGEEPAVLRQVHEGIDKLALATRPATPYLQEFYTPGAGLSVLANATNSVASLVSKAAPWLGKGIAGKVAKTALTEGIVGAPAGVGNQLAKDPQSSGQQLLEAGLYGAGGGAVLGGVGKAGKEIVRWGKESTGSALAGVAGRQAEALDGAVRADLPQTVRRVTSNGSVPELFPERFRRTVSQGASETAPDVGENAVRSGAAATLREIQNEAETRQLRNTNKQTDIANVEQQVARERGVDLNRLYDEAGSQSVPAAIVRQTEQTAATVEAPRAPRVDTTAVNERGNYRNQRENGNFSNDFNEGLNNRDTTYERITNADTVAKANDNVKNLSATEATFLGNQEYSAEHIATGYRLMQELDSAGQVATDPALRKEYTERAVNISEKLAEDLTRAGQTVQAASILQRLSPEGQLLHLQRAAKKAGKEVSTADADLYRTLARDVQKSTFSGSETSEFLNILDRLKAGKPVSAEEMKKASLILEDAKKFVKNADDQAEQAVELPEELKDTRKRDKVLSYLEKQAEEARKQWDAKRNIGFAQKIGESDIVLLAKMGTYQLAKAGVTIADFTEAMVKEFGDSVRPHMSEVFDRSKKLLTGTSKHISEGKLEQANDAFRRISGQAEAEKAVVKEMATHVRQVIAAVKEGSFDLEDIQKIRELSDEIAKFPVTGKPPTEEVRFLQNVKSLAKKIGQAEAQRTVTSETTKQVAALLQRVTKLSAADKVPSAASPLDAKALDNLAHDLLLKTRPNPVAQSAAEKVMEKFIKQGNIAAEDEQTLRDLAKQLHQLTGAKGTKANMKMQEILNGYQKSSVGAKISTLRYMSMLLNSGTQLVNAVSGPVMMAYNQMLDIIVTPFDAMFAAVMRRDRTTTMFQGPGAFDHLFSPIVDYFKGLKVGGEAGWKGVDPEGITTQHDIRGLAFKSKINPLGLGERSLGLISKAPDYATYNATKNMELRKLAYLDALNKRIKGKENIRAHMDRYLADPPAKAVEQAARLGKKVTFQNTDGLAGKAARVARSANALTGSEHIGVANAVVPFVRTPTNIAITAVENTPAGILKGLFEINRLRNGADDITKREIIKTLASATAGGTAILGGLGYVLSDLGIVTGDSSTNKDVRELQDAIGQGKFRFNTTAFGRMFNALFTGDMDKIRQASKYRPSDRQVDYNKLQPIAFPFAAGATFADQQKLAKHAKARGEEYPLSKQLGAAATAAGTSLYGMSSLQGLSDTFNTDPSSDTAPWLQIVQNAGESFIKGFSPSTLGQEARRQDPIQRQVSYNKSFSEDVGSYYKSRYPGQSQSLPPRITKLGDTKENAPGVMGQYFNPLRSEQVKYNEAAAVIFGLIQRTGNEKLAPTAVDKEIEGKLRVTGEKVTIKLTPEQYTKLQEDVGRQIAEQVLGLPSGMGDVEMAEKIEGIYSKVRETERNKLKKELGIRIPK